MSQSHSQKKHCGLCNTLEPVTHGVTKENPILAHALGICSALAVTGFLKTTLVMCAALMAVTCVSTFTVSLLRNVTPHRVRMIVQMLVISMLVILVDQFLKAYAWDMSKKLSIYIGLIITNCLIMGRCEAYSMHNGPVKAMLDGLGAALGYSLVLLAIALIRETLGYGMILNTRILPESYPNMGLAASAAGAFIAMGVVVWILRAIWPEPETTEHPEAN